MNTKCIIIGQNSENLKILETLLEKNNKFSVLSSFNDFNNSKDFLESIEVDIIFIFFNIPEFNPFTFLDLINSNSHIILISEQTEHAFQSFDYNILDYIKLPLTEEKIEKIDQKLNKLSEKYNKKGQGHLYVKSNLKKRKVYIKDIEYIKYSK